MKNKKGFTLIELLAVIVVLAIILVIAGTNAIKYINTTKEKAKFIAAKEIVAIAEAYMETKNLDVVSIETLISENYLEADVTNPKTGENSWSVDDKKQYIVRNSNAQEQEDFAVDEVEYYNFNGYTYVANPKFDISEEFGISTTELKSICDEGFVFSKGECRNLADLDTPNEEDEENNLADSDTPEVEENEPGKDEDNEPAETETCSVYYNVAKNIKNAAIKFLEEHPTYKFVGVNALINSGYYSGSNPFYAQWGTSNVSKDSSALEEDGCKVEGNFTWYYFDGYIVKIFTK